jgi:hypothetical protein
MIGNKKQENLISETISIRESVKERKWILVTSRGSEEIAG